MIKYIFAFLLIIQIPSLYGEEFDFKIIKQYDEIPFQSPINFRVSNYIYFEGTKGIVGIDINTYKKRSFKTRMSMYGIYRDKIYASIYDYKATKSNFFLLNPENEIIKESMPNIDIFFFEYRGGYAIRTEGEFGLGEGPSEPVGPVIFNIFTGDSKRIGNLAGKVMALSPDKRFLLVADFDFVYVYDLRLNKKLHSYKQKTKISQFTIHPGYFIGNDFFVAPNFNDKDNLIGWTMWNLAGNFKDEIKITVNHQKMEFGMFGFADEFSYALIVPAYKNELILADATPFRDWLVKNGYLYKPRNGLISRNTTELYYSPSFDEDIKKTLKQGQKITILDQSSFKENADKSENYWYKITTDTGDEGWVYSSFVEIGKEK
jgi:hypothetical protein